jgi:hypothetical protein
MKYIKGMMYMKKELAIKQIYNDFTSKTFLTDNEKDILIRYIKNDSIVKIADNTMQSTSTISRIIADIKEKYIAYKKLEIAKLNILKQNK